MENRHLREILLQTNPGTTPFDRMAFGLRQLRIETLPDMPDVLQATLNMTLFNYGPFSLDFGYRGFTDRSVEAYESDDFRMFIDTWMQG